MAESTTLLRTPGQKKVKYRLQLIRSKGAVLVIIIDALIKWFHCYIIFTSSLLQLEELKILETRNLLFVTLIFYPVFGLIADMFVGRYKMMLGSMLFCLITWILIVVVTLLYIYIETYSMLFGSIGFVMLGISFLGIAGFQSIVIPFNIDQLMGASSDELSATIYWHAFTGVIPIAVFVILECYFTLYAVNAFTVIMIHLSIGGLSLVLALSILFIFKHYLDTTPQFYNPIKLIFQVLNYARRNKYPRNRSALTFWENRYPSRIDLGKDKYGGPFTVEQVEDVKTAIRLIPILISVIGLNFCPTNMDMTLFLDNNFFVMVFIEGSTSLMAMFILTHLFILYPCCSKYIPSMLKRIGLGLVFIFVSTLEYTIILLVYHSSLQAVPPDYKWILILPLIAYEIGAFLVIITCLEFVLAQSPKSMRGLMIGLYLSSFGFGIMSDQLVLFLFQKTFAHGNDIDALLYTTIVDCIIVLLVLLSFVIIAKYYKFRIRENIVPVHLIAEEHYERYQEQSDEYRRARGLSYTDSY